MNADATSKVWTPEEIKENLRSNDVWVVRAILALFKKQTAVEQNAENTLEDNGVGFNAADSAILSSFAKQIIRWESTTSQQFPTPLSSRQMEIARKKVIKYAKQLTRIANKEIPNE
jgi:hypothetical protein